MRTQHVRLGAAYPWLKKGQTPPRRQIGAWAGPRESILRPGRESPSFDVEFPATAPLLGRRQEHFVYGANAMVDQRAGVPHWGRGFRLAAGVERFDDAIEALSIRDPHTLSPRFTR